MFLNLIKTYRICKNLFRFHLLIKIFVLVIAGVFLLVDKFNRQSNFLRLTEFLGGFFRLFLEVNIAKGNHKVHNWFFNIYKFLVLLSVVDALFLGKVLSIVLGILRFVHILDFQLRLVLHLEELFLTDIYSILLHFHNQLFNNTILFHHPHFPLLLRLVHSTLVKLRGWIWSSLVSLLLILLLSILLELLLLLGQDDDFLFQSTAFFGEAFPGFLKSCELLDLVN